MVVAVIADKHGRSKDDNDPVLILLGLLVFGGLAVNIFGAVGGILALVKRTSHKWMALTGLIFNVLEFIVVFGLMIVGLLMK